MGVAVIAQYPLDSAPLQPVSGPTLTFTLEIPANAAPGAYNITAKHEGILPALESSHALAQAFKEARRLGSGKVLAVCLSGRGDKDAYEVARLRGEPI